ncbi:MAG TPA: SMC family ATPase [Nitrosopumilaceae archaeon]|nr:SMC family ATPase [Nitrosopumilaceae archaeon]
MIESIELGNFLSHNDTKLKFGEGVTVFIGHNGAGKSSIIDAITFALFGKHTRKNNKGLIRRGQNEAYTTVNFSINSKKLQATRKIHIKGTSSSQFLEEKDGTWIPIVEGERKQFEESTTKKIEEYIGLDFEKLKIASIVQQGELNSIIKAKPKEFKELINAVIGIDKLDLSAENMKLVLKNFRSSIQNELGYDYSHIEILKNEIINLELEKKQNIPLKDDLLSKKEIRQKEILQIKQRIDKEQPKLDKIKQLESRKTELKQYAKDAILSIQKEISEKERKIRDCEGCFEHLDDKKIIEKSLDMAESSIKDSKDKIQEFKMKTVSLVEQISLAGKLHIQDGKCPVCDSSVKHLNPLFREEHLKEELDNMKKQIITLEKQAIIFENNRDELRQKIERIREDEATLRAHSIKNITEINIIKQEIIVKKSNMQKIPLTINDGKLVEVASIDSHAKLLYQKIIELESETEGFDETEFFDLKESLEHKQLELSSIDQKLGGILEKIRNNENQLEKNNHTLKELTYVKDYVLQLEQIQENVFNRDGPVATSLRSWALSMISAKASEYLSMLNTKIQRIELSEKARDVSITCYAKNTILDLESLSGGEQVSIALALRLGMAQLLGSSNLNFIILDEPTMHLDEERRKSLVGVLSQLSDITNSASNSSMQFIIITHDAEIFEDSTVEQIFKFESSDNGTTVTTV